MTKKHYEMIAAEFRKSAMAYRQAGWEKEELQVLLMAARLANAFAADNSNFNREKFLAACRGE